MASYLRPRRGKLATAKSTFNSDATNLKSGEVFFEYPSSAGAGQGRIMMGSGASGDTYTKMSTYNSTYGTSRYFLDPDSMTVAVSANSGTDEGTLINMISGSYSLAKVLGAIKQLLTLHKNAITSLNNDLPYFSKFDNRVGSVGKSYTATKNCVAICTLITSGSAYEVINIKINTKVVRTYQNPGSVASLVDRSLIFLKKGDVITVDGNSDIGIYN